MSSIDSWEMTHSGRHLHTRVWRRRRQRGQVDHASWDVGVRNAICPWCQVTSAIRDNVGESAGRRGEVHCPRSRENAGSAESRAEGRLNACAV